MPNNPNEGEEQFNPQLTRRELLSLPLFFALLKISQNLSSCFPQRPTDKKPPSPTPSPSPKPPVPPQLEPTPQPTPTLEKGSTIPRLKEGEILAIGGINMKLVQIDGQDLAKRIGEEGKNWTIITDDRGKINFLVGYGGLRGKEVQEVKIAQAPPGFKWDEENQIWYKGNEVFIPDILLPGGWYTEKNLAGPAHEADQIFVFQNGGGAVRVGIIYSKEKMSSIPDKSKLTILPDGSGLFVSNPKTVNLEQNQTIIRDGEGNLRLVNSVNSDGGYLLKKTSWTNVKSEDEVYQAIGFAGPFKDQPNIPYPSESFQKQRQISDYGKLIDGSIVAYQHVADPLTGKTKKLVVAYFNVNKKEWQPTIPLEDLAVPDPKTANPELFDMAGIGVKGEEVAKNIIYISTKNDGAPLVDKGGNPFVVATYYLDPDPKQKGETLKGETLEGPIPLMVWTKEGGWRNIIYSLETLVEANNFKFGTQIVYYKINDPNYTKIAGGNFNFFASSGEINEPLLWKMNNPDETYDYDYSRIDALLNFAKNSGTTLFHIKNLVEPRIYPDHPFWPQWVTNLSPKELQRVIQQRIIQTLGHVKEVKGPNMTIIYSVVSEAFDWDKFTGFVNDKLGSNYIENAYQIARQVSPEAILIYEDVNTFHEGKVDDHDRAVIELVSNLKSKGLIDGVGLEMHLDAARLPSPDVFRQLIRSYKKSSGVKIYVTEFDIDFSNYRGSEVQKQMLKARVYSEMLRVAMEEKIDAFVMFGFTGAAAWHPDGLLFNKNYNPEAAFYAAASVLLSRLISSPN